MDLITEIRRNPKPAIGAALLLISSLYFFNRKNIRIAELERQTLVLKIQNGITPMVTGNVVAVSYDNTWTNGTPYYIILANRELYSFIKHEQTNSVEEFKVGEWVAFPRVIAKTFYPPVHCGAFRAGEIVRVND